MPHEVFGPYRTLDRLGEGAFGRVYLAEDTRRPSSHLVALKVGAGPAERRSHAVAQLQKEAELLQRLEHPHIVAYEDFGIDDAQDVMWLALEVLDGGSLRTILEGRRRVGSPCPESFLRRVVLEIGSALQYIHAEGLLHRDVKPANILLTLTAPPVLKLADFGISKLLEDARAAHSIVGTQCYFSPELISGEPYASPADCWAFGVVLFELASLSRPFSGGSMLELAMATCQQPAPPLPRLAQDLTEVIQGFLHKEVGCRWQLEDALNLIATTQDASTAQLADGEDCSISLSSEGFLTELELAPQDAAPGPPAVAFEHQPAAKSKKEWASLRAWFSWWPFSAKAADERHDTQVSVIEPAPSGLPTSPISRPTAHEMLQVESWDVQSLPGEASSFSTRQ